MYLIFYLVGYDNMIIRWYTLIREIHTFFLRIEKKILHLFKNKIKFKSMKWKSIILLPIGKFRYNIRVEDMIYFIWAKKALSWKIVNTHTKRIVFDVGDVICMSRQVRLRLEKIQRNFFEAVGHLCRNLI